MLKNHILNDWLPNRNTNIITSEGRSDEDTDADEIENQSGS